MVYPNWLQCIIKGMIRNFRHRGIERFFETGSTKGINSAHAQRLKVRLEAMELATDIEDLDQPGWRLHELTGDRKGTWSIHVTANYRLTFRIEDRDCLDVDYEDYH